MYKAITSFWSKSSSNKIQSSSETTLDEESWVFVVSNAESPAMTNSWFASPPLIKADQSSGKVHRFNPIENLLIEHASMSVYEQIASKTRNRRQRKTLNDHKLDEQTEEEEEEEEEEEDDRPVINHQPTNVTSIQHRNSNQSSTTTTTLDSSTHSLIAHHRHLHRLHQRRKRSKLILPNSIDEPKQVLHKNLDRQRLRSAIIPS